MRIFAEGEIPGGASSVSFVLEALLTNQTEFRKRSAAESGSHSPKAKCRELCAKFLAIRPEVCYNMKNQKGGGFDE